MNAVMLDTNVLIRILAALERIPASFSQYEKVLIPSIVIGEYRAGLYATHACIESARKLDEYTGRATVETVPITDRTAELYAKVYQALRKGGTPIPQNDMWIAASVLEHGADLATYDEHFHLVPMLSVVMMYGEMR